MKISPLDSLFLRKSTYPVKGAIGSYFWIWRLALKPDPNDYLYIYVIGGTYFSNLIPFNNKLSFWFKIAIFYRCGLHSLRYLNFLQYTLSQVKFFQSSFFYDKNLLTSKIKYLFYFYEDNAIDGNCSTTRWPNFI